MSPQPTNANRGNDVLGQIFGSRDVSRAVAQNASGSSGLDPALLKKMLPILAMLAAGYMAKQHSGGGVAASVQSAGGGLGGLLGGLFGGGDAGAEPPPATWRSSIAAAAAAAARRSAAAMPARCPGSPRCST